jgi:hypothetical protein
MVKLLHRLTQNHKPVLSFPRTSNALHIALANQFIWDIT